MKFRDCIEVCAFVAVVVADAYGWVPLSQTVVLVPMIWLILRLRREAWASIGWRRPPRLGRAIAIGVAAGLAMEIFAVTVTTPAISGYFGVQPDYSELSAVRGNLPMLLLFLALSWSLAAFGEEICFRGFLMQRLARISASFSADGRVSWVIALVLNSILFGWGHTEQGVSGWIQEGLSGFLLGLLFLFGGRNLAIPIVAHGVSNTLAFVLIYLGRYPGIG